MLCILCAGGGIIISGPVPVPNEHFPRLSIRGTHTLVVKGAEKKKREKETQHRELMSQFHSVQVVQYVYLYLYFVSIVGAVIGPVLYRSYLCCVGSHLYPSHTPWFHPWLHNPDSH